MSHLRSILPVSLALLVTTSCQGTPKTDTTSSTGASSAKIEVQKVAWPKKDQIDKGALAQLGEESQRKIPDSTVPVLVPSDPKLLAVGVVMVDAVYYAFSANADGITVSIHATRVAHKYDDIPPTPGVTPIRGTKGFVTENEGIRATSWSEFGISYSLDLECGTAGDARCKDDAYVLQLTEGLRYVGGGAQ